MATILKRARFFLTPSGEPKEVLLPFEAYQELLDTKISQEVFEDPHTQSSLRHSLSDLKKGRYREFSTSRDLLKWLKK